MEYVFFYAFFLLCQLACFIITVYVGQLLVHYVKWSRRCDYLFEQINDDDDDDDDDDVFSLFTVLTAVHLQTANAKFYKVE